MYLKYFGFNDKPFKLTQDLSYYYGPAHHIPLNELSYSIEEEQGLALLIGGPGLGKTTVLRRLHASLPQNFTPVFMSDNSLSGQSLLEHLVALLKLRVPAKQWHYLASHLQNLAARGRKLVLLVDEAQGLTPHQLEEIRYLTNLELRGARVIEVILAGLPELQARLSRPEYAALSQRVAVRCTVEPLDREHTGAYISHRLRVAGAANPELFTGEAVRAIHEATEGVPRLVNVLCDRALLTAFARDDRVVDREVLDAAVADLKRFEETEDPAAPAGGEGASEIALAERVLERLEAIEEKQDRLLDLLARAGLVELGDEEKSEAERRWIERLRREGRNPSAPRRIR